MSAGQKWTASGMDEKCMKSCTVFVVHKVLTMLLRLPAGDQCKDVCY